MSKETRRWWQRLMPEVKDAVSYVRNVVSGTFYRVSDMRNDSCWSTIETVINTMDALERDSQIATALDYYATDSTLINTKGQVIWASPVDNSTSQAADIVNELFKRWDVHALARDHIRELAKLGNLYIPTSHYYRDASVLNSRTGIALDNNTLAETDFDIYPIYMIDPKTIIHVWKHGKPKGFMIKDDDESKSLILPESACIHFSLGGLLGKYTVDAMDRDGDISEYDIQFASPLLEKAVQPTQTLSLLEDANVLSSLARVIKFICVEAGTEETEIMNSLTMIKNAIEQQLSVNTAAGDAQSFVNPQSPNNFIYLPNVNGQAPISIVDLDMASATDADSKLLEYYQNKKLSVMGIPKEAMNFSSNEGLGGAGSVLSQRSSLYANILSRLEAAYMAGWRKALNTYFTVRGMSGLVDTYDLHMLPIVTPQATVEAEKRDAAIGQATSIVSLLKELGVTDADSYRPAITEILSDTLPSTSVDAMSWKLNIQQGGEMNV